MRLRLPTLLLTAAVSLAAAPAADAAGCFDKRGRTVEENRQARVYWRAVGEDRHYYACLRRAHRSVELGETDLRTSLGGIRLRGRFVKWHDVSVDSYGDVLLSIALMNVKTQHRASWVFNQRSPTMDELPELRLYGERLKRNGSYAFLVGPFDDEWPTRNYAVIRRDGRGEVRLDTGQDIDRRSFRASADTIKWTRGGVPHTADFR
jgi:hypothetical protein